jgi:hypothetical protein
MLGIAPLGDFAFGQLSGGLKIAIVQLLRKAVFVLTKLRVNQPTLTD